MRGKCNTSSNGLRRSNASIPDVRLWLDRLGDCVCTGRYDADEVVQATRRLSAALERRLVVDCQMYDGAISRSPEFEKRVRELKQNQNRLRQMLAMIEHSSHGNPLHVKDLFSDFAEQWIEYDALEETLRCEMLENSALEDTASVNRDKRPNS